MLSVKHEQKRNQVSFRFNLDQVETFDNFRQFPERFGGMPPGADRWENAVMGDGVYRRIRVNGKAKFRWVCNRSGSTVTRGTLVSFHRQTIICTTGTTGIFRGLVGTFVEHENLWDLLYILDDAGGAGAAPEGEMGVIHKAVLNAAGTHIEFTCQTPRANGLFSAAPAAGDTAAIRSMHNVIPVNVTDEVHEFAGVVVREDGIPDNNFGWVCYEADQIEIAVKAATALSAGDGFKPADNANGASVTLNKIINSVGTNLVGGLVYGVVLEVAQADLVNDFALCNLKLVGADEA